MGSGAGGAGGAGGSVGGAGGSAGSGIALPSCPAGWTEVFRDDFDSLDTTTRWQYYTGGENHSQAYYLSDAESVRVADGQLEIVTRRHCTDGNPQPDAASHPAPCPTGTATKYSSGYLQSRGYHAPDRGRLIVLATLPPRQRGLWPAIWLRNGRPWCTAGYGELDTMEWWYDDQNGDPIWQQYTVTTHATCAGDQTKMDNSSYDPPGNTDMTTGPHVFETEWNSTEQWAKHYYRETVAAEPIEIASHTPATIGVSSAEFDAAIGDDGGWQVRLNTQVVKPGYAWAGAADDTAPFNDSTYHIDLVIVCAP